MRRKERKKKKKKQEKGDKREREREIGRGEETLDERVRYKPFDLKKKRDNNTSKTR